MGDMPRRRPPYLNRETTRHGKTVWFVRVGAGPRFRIRAEFGTAEFKAEYEAALRGERLEAKKGVARSGSLNWLIERYREVSAWKNLSLATRRQRENIFRGATKTAGNDPYEDIAEETIAAGRDRRSDTPAQARHFLDTMNGLFKWAKGAGFVRVNPVVGVEYPTKPKTQGFPAWTEADVIKYEKHWPIGTKERVWLDVLLYTGLRRGDAVRIGRQHVRDGVAVLRTEKSQGEVEVTLPLLPVLLATLNAGPTGELAFICGERGGPLKKESFGNLFREACNAAGVYGKSAHGVRKIGATRAAERGATEAELDALFGWRGGKMAALYTRSANRARLSTGAITLLANETRTSIPAPVKKVRGSGRKK